jgi:hypothetical protein
MKINLDLYLAMLELLADCPDGGRILKAGFLAEVLPTFPPEQRAQFDQEISDAEFAATLAGMRLEMPAFRNWLLNGFTPSREAEKFWNDRSRLPGKN